ncbi:MAG TPA: hypothetical protein VF800_29730 [Telluria sp.]
MSIYHVGHENLAYHRHAHVSDITYCASGRLMLELPSLGGAYIFHPGQFVQVPCDTVHRVSHCAPHAEHSTYILVQIGPFSIDFERDAGIVHGRNPVDLGDTSLGYRIGDARERLRSVARQLREERPASLSDAEHASILGMLDTVCKDGIAAAPDRAVLLAQFHALGTSPGGVPADH